MGCWRGGCTGDACARSDSGRGDSSVDHHGRRSATGEQRAGDDSTGGKCHGQLHGQRSVTGKSRNSQRFLSGKRLESGSAAACKRRRDCCGARAGRIAGDGHIGRRSNNSGRRCSGRLRDQGLSRQCGWRLRPEGGEWRTRCGQWRCIERWWSGLWRRLRWGLWRWFRERWRLRSRFRQWRPRRRQRTLDPHGGRKGAAPQVRDEPAAFIGPSL